MLQSLLSPASDFVVNVVLEAIEVSLLLLRQVAVILGHVALFLILNTGLFSFQMSGPPRSYLAILDFVADFFLLILFAAVHFIDTRMAGVDVSGACARSRTNG